MYNEYLFNKRFIAYQMSQFVFYINAVKQSQSVNFCFIVIEN